MKNKIIPALLLAGILCGCGSINSTEPTEAPDIEPSATAEMPSNPDASAAYYEAKEAIDGCVLYTSSGGEYGIQVPDDAHFYDVSECITRIMFSYNDDPVQIYINENESAAPEYGSEEEIVESFARDGLNFTGDVTNLTRLYDNDENIGYQFMQEVTDVAEPYGEIYRYYYSAPYSIMASLPNLSDDTIDAISVYLDSFQILK